MFKLFCWLYDHNWKEKKIIIEEISTRFPGSGEKTVFVSKVNKTIATCRRCGKQKEK